MKKKKPARKATKGKTGAAGSKQTDVKAAAKSARVENSELTRVRGHVSARTRRDQAKRDAKQ